MSCLVLFLTLSAAAANSALWRPQPVSGTLTRSAVQMPSEVSAGSEPTTHGYPLPRLHRRSHRVSTAQQTDIEMGPTEPTAGSSPISRQQTTAQTVSPSQQISPPSLSAISVDSITEAPVPAGPASGSAAQQGAPGRPVRGNNELDTLEHAAGRVDSATWARMHDEHVAHLLARHHLSPRHRVADERLLQRISDPWLRDRTAALLGLYDRVWSRAAPGATPSQDHTMRILRRYLIRRRQIPAM